MENNENKKEITLLYLFRILKKGILWVVISALFFGLLGASYAYFMAEPSYHGEITIWANDGMLEFQYKTEDPSNGEEYYAVRQWIKEAPYVATFSVQMIKEKVLAQAAVKKHGLTEKLGCETEEEAIARVISMLSATKDDDDSYAFTVRATAPSKKAVFDVLIAVQDVMPEVVSQMTGLVPGTGGQLMKPSTTIETLDDIGTSKLSVIKAFVICSFMAAVIAYLVIFVRHMLDSKVYGEKTVKENFSQPIIGSIPTWASTIPEKKKSFIKMHERNYEGRLLTANTPFAIAEAFNSLRTNLIFSTSAYESPVVAVTSSVSAEGKSLISANIATSMSLLEKKVLLVECDMRCPILSKIFKAKVTVGLSEVLAGISTDEDIINKTSSENLDVVYCGKIPPNPSELLSSPTMKELVNKWQSLYDYIILDLPPVCEVADAGVISGIVSGYIITVRSNYSETHEIKSCISRIGAVDGNIMGFVVNDVNLKSGAGYGGEYRRNYRRSSYYRIDNEQ